MPSAANEFFKRVAAEGADGEVRPSEFDVLAQQTEIVSLLERLSTGKRHAFDSIAGENPLADFFHQLVAIVIERMARRVKAAPAPQITSLEPDNGSLSWAINGTTGQH